MKWTYEVDQEVPWVRRHCISDGSDCDGRYSNYRTSVCIYEGLMNGPMPGLTPEDDTPLTRHTWVNVRWPAWCVENQGQRDYTAEAHGY